MLGTIKKEIVYMKEIEEQIQVVLEKMDSMSERLEIIDKKAKELLEAVTNQNRPPLGPR